ncbi:ABC transporter substrate-binding protein [Psychromonas hadalis]|uniref:ABC transporter substrate-binding protein n=1 Tax=Psychromonas hadalis TaxID=211669 RepID=UPI00041A68ED|nr:ABC transporter substrate-binding protein [Psychromonas hadalis]
MRYLPLTLYFLSFNGVAQTQELLHWWSSKGELKALQTIEKIIQQENKQIQQHYWQVNAIVGEGGLSASKVLQTRGLAGTLPTLAQLSGTEITTWAKFGLLQPLDNTAKQENWELLMRPLALQVSRYQGQYIALPLAIHRINWLWTNNQIFRQQQQIIPKSVDQFIAVIKVFNAQNIKPLAIGNQPWQIAILFENIALGLTSSTYYKKAFVELDKQAIKAEKMHFILNKFREISLLIKPTISKQSWENATLTLLHHQAAMQLSGDWVLGEIIAIDDDALSYINCSNAPGTEGTFIYNMDNIVHFKNSNNQRQNMAAQKVLRQLSSSQLQHDFSKAKGALPARIDVDMSDFNRCTLQAEKDYTMAKQNATLLPSMTDSMAVNPVIQKMLINQIYTFFNNPNISNQIFIDNFTAIASGSSIR